MINIFLILALLIFIISIYVDRTENKTKLKEDILDDKKTQFSFKVYAWKQFKKNKVALISLYLLGILTLIAIFAPFIANEKPIYAVYKGKALYPVFDEVIYGQGEYIINPKTDKD